MTTAAIANDEDLVTKARQGDRNAFSELVGRYSQGVLNVVYRMCGNTQLAEDAAQEAFIQAWLKLSTYRSQTSLRNWLYRIAVNITIDILRKEKRLSFDEINDSLVDPEPDPETTLTREERGRLIQGAILSLPTASRSVLVLREYEGLSYHEISNVLNIPIGTVMSRLSYARNLLREALKPQLLMQAEVENV